jgi:hypothetical protein
MSHKARPDRPPAGPAADRAPDQRNRSRNRPTKAPSQPTPPSPEHQFVASGLKLLDKIGCPQARRRAQLVRVGDRIAEAVR